jgi:hypothetical protein
LYVKTICGFLFVGIECLILDEDDAYQYRHVILDKDMAPLIPKNRLMDECEWRTLGIKQGPHWEHYLIHKPGRVSFFSNVTLLL